MIKQWLVNYLLRDVRIIQHDHISNTLPGYTLKARGWTFIIPSRPCAEQAAAPTKTEIPYVPRYGLRSEFEHDAIRKGIQKNWKTCLHTKGGRLAISKDYNVSCFTFVDGSRQIKCLSCRHVWTPQSLYWKEAQRMMDNSTNTPNACEQALRWVVSTTSK